MLEVKDATIGVGGLIFQRNLSFVAMDGQLTCITGAEGSGKTTLLRTLMGFLPLAEGFVSIDGEMLTPDSAPFFRRMIAYLPQNAQWLSHLLYPAEMPEYEADEQAVWDALLPACPRLPEVKPLSADEVYRLLEQVVTQTDKTMVVADEPAASLSSQQTAQLLSLLRRQANEGRAVLIVSRRQEIISQCDKLISLNSDNV